jgi:hypothetical protein
VTFEQQVRAFSDLLQGTLNRTVTTGISLRSLFSPTESIGWIGYKISKTDLAGVPIPLTIGDRPSRLYLSVQHTLRPELQSDLLVTSQSSYGVYTDSAGENLLFHYDYTRDPTHSYPPAHVQVG